MIYMLLSMLLRLELSDWPSYQYKESSSNTRTAVLRTRLPGSRSPCWPQHYHSGNNSGPVLPHLLIAWVCLHRLQLQFYLNGQSEKTLSELAYSAECTWALSIHTKACSGRQQQQTPIILPNLPNTTCINITEIVLAYLMWLVLWEKCKDTANKWRKR